MQKQHPPADTDDKQHQQRYSDHDDMPSDTLMNDSLCNSCTPCNDDEAVQERCRTVDTQWKP